MFVIYSKMILARVKRECKETMTNSEIHRCCRCKFQIKQADFAISGSLVLDCGAVNDKLEVTKI